MWYDEYKKQILKNGITIITVPNPTCISFNLQLIIKVGSKHDSVHGISHFLEHMVFKGTKKLKTSIKLLEALDNCGCSYNAYTSKNHTNYHFKVPYENQKDIIHILSDMMFNSKFKQSDIDIEKGVVIEELNKYF